MKTLALILCALILVSSCAPTREMQLDKIKTLRAFPGSKEDVMNAVRFFIAAENMNMKRFEPAFGQVLAGTLVDGKTIVMKLNIYPSDSAKTTVDARFTFANIEGTATRRDEDMLVDYYYRLFDLLDERFPAPASGK